jgi:DNA-binding FadR family transcriptional regulator
MERANFMHQGATSNLLPPRFDRRSREPVQTQLYAWLRRAIWRGDLPGGCVLPSTRVLAKQLGVSRNTALYAYETLIAEGLIAARRGSGTRVLGAPAAAPKRRRDLTWILRDAHYPVAATPFADPDGNPLYAHS